ncbi:hypothetical protein ID866_4056 [Astraeus odoratus]|nr:hypothetical protein ID866_4056 [Astraeus odoratus]
MAAPAGYNYAAGAGIYDFPAAVVFAVFYVFLLVFFAFKSFSRPTFVFFVMSFFCTIRVAAFILRSLLAKVTADAENVNFFVAYSVIYNIGFFGLLYSTFTLVLDRFACAKNQPHGPFFALLRRRFIFRLALTTAVTLGITGSIQSLYGTQTSTISTGDTLRKVATFIFLGCTAVVLLLAFLLARVEAYGGSGGSGYSFGGRYGTYILIVISLLLLARETFFAATIDKPNVQGNEHVWYPLAALSELLAVMLFATPGLVPPRSEIPQDSPWA